MKTATVRELRTAFPKVEAWLAEGERVLITKGGKPVAQLIEPPRKRPDFVKRFGGPIPKPRAGAGVVALLLKERGE